MNNPSLIIFITVYFAVFTVCAIDPYDRAVWWAENIPMWILFGSILAVHRIHQFSALSYFFMSCLLVMHTVGGHFTFSRVPFDMVTDFFGFERNHYDRIAHFTVGFYAYPIAELLLKKRWVNHSSILYLFSIFAIFTVAGAYEIVEWVFAIFAQPDAGLAVLGSQGDQWDAQKDMLADVLGAMAVLPLFTLIYREEISTLNQH